MHVFILKLPPSVLFYFHSKGLGATRETATKFGEKHALALFIYTS